MKQYRDDLLASCLTMILALPKEIITEEMSEVVPAIQVCDCSLIFDKGHHIMYLNFCFGQLRYFL